MVFRSFYFYCFCAALVFSIVAPWIKPRLSVEFVEVWLFYLSAADVLMFLALVGWLGNLLLVVTKHVLKENNWHVKF